MPDRERPYQRLIRQNAIKARHQRANYSLACRRSRLSRWGRRAKAMREELIIREREKEHANKLICLIVRGIDLIKSVIDNSMIRG